MRRLKVLHVITMLELGGAQRNTLDTVARLDRRRFEVGLACADRGELLDEARLTPDMALFLLRHLRREVRPYSDLRATSELRRAIAAFAPDIVHTHSSKAGMLGRLTARLASVPVIIHSIHGFGFGPHQSGLARTTFVTAERLAARWTTHFIAVSRANLEDGVMLGLFPAEDVSVIRSGIDLRAFYAHHGGGVVRREIGIPADAPLVVQVACFKPQKAPERFVALAALLAPAFPAAHFLLVGDGALRGELERARTAAGLDGRLHMPGWRRDMSAIYDAATVVTLTSRFEGLPRALVEARAAGVPVAAMAVDGVREVVRDGETGFLVAPGNVAALVERVGALLAGATLRERLAAAAVAGLEEWDRDLMVRQQERLYTELAAAGLVTGEDSTSTRALPAPGGPGG